MLTPIIQKTLIAMAINVGLAAFLALMVPEYFFSVGDAVLWGALGGVVRALIDGFGKGKISGGAIIINGWHFIVIGGISAAALSNARVPFFEDYLKDLPSNAVEFLVGNFAVSAFALVDEVMRIRLGFLRGSKGGDA